MKEAVISTSELTKKLLEDVGKKPITKCSFCGTKSEKVVLTSKSRAEIVDGDSAAFSCVNIACKPAQQALFEMKFIEQRLVAEMDATSLEIKRMSEKPNDYLAKMQVELAEMKKQVQSKKLLFENRTQLLTGWKKMREDFEKLWKGFWIWKQKNLSFINLEKYFNRNSKHWHWNNSLWLWTMVVAAASLLVGFILLLLNFV